jgi:hypothetical protein
VWAPKFRPSSQNTTRTPVDGLRNGANPSFMSFATAMLPSLGGHDHRPTANYGRRDPGCDPGLLRCLATPRAATPRRRATVPIPGRTDRAPVKHRPVVRRPSGSEASPLPLQALNHSHLNFNSFAFGRPLCESITLISLRGRRRQSRASRGWGRPAIWARQSGTCGVMVSATRIILCGRVCYGAAARLPAILDIGVVMAVRCCRER